MGGTGLGVATKKMTGVIDEKRKEIDSINAGMQATGTISYEDYMAQKPSDMTSQAFLTWLSGLQNYGSNITPSTSAEYGSNTLISDPVLAQKGIEASGVQKDTKRNESLTNLRRRMSMAGGLARGKRRMSPRTFLGAGSIGSILGGKELIGA